MIKAVICTQYGPPEIIQLQEVEKPTPKDNKVLIRDHAATVTRGDVMLRKLHPLLLLRLFGMRRNKIPGHELAGVIESAGKGVKRFRESDPVFGTTKGNLVITIDPI